jgi:hypothetical protein
VHNHDISGTRSNAAEKTLSPANVHGLKVQWTFPTKGLVSGTPVANGVVFVNTSDWPNGSQGGPPASEGPSAISGDGAPELWHFTTPGSPNLPGVAVANGVVYFQSTFDGNLYALDAQTGRCWTRWRPAASRAARAVSHSHVYLGTGNAFAPLADLVRLDDLVQSGREGLAPGPEGRGADVAGLAERRRPRRTARQGRSGQAPRGRARRLPPAVGPTWPHCSVASR